MSRTERKGVRRGLLERLGALLLSGVFVHGGFNTLREPGGRGQKAAKLGLPGSDLLVRANGAATARPWASGSSRSSPRWSWPAR